MKKRMFLVYIAAIVASVSVVVGCSDNNEPPFEPTPEPSGAETKNDSEYKYPTDTIIYVDERTEDEKDWLGDGLIVFKEESFKNYGVVVTYRLGDNSYEIYIPAQGAELDLEVINTYGWLYTFEYAYINHEKVDLKVEYLTEPEENEYGNKYYYFYKLTHDHITVVFDEKDVLRYRIPENTTGEELRIKTIVNNPPMFFASANIIFIQAAK